MHTHLQNVCSIEVLNPVHKQFWIQDINCLLAKYPVFGIPHFQNFHVILFINNGVGKIVMDNKQIDIHEKTVLVLPSGCINKLELSPCISGKIIGFGAPFFGIEETLNRKNQFPFLNDDSEIEMNINQLKKNKLEQLIELIYEEYINEQKACYSIIHSYLNILLYEIDRLILPNNSAQIRKEKMEKINQFEKLINEHYLSKKLPSEYADLLNVTPNYLNKLCKKSTGLTAGEIIRERIALEAKKMLLHSYNNINEIAYKLGFENTSYFVTFFKKKTGFTPEKYRNQLS